MTTHIHIIAGHAFEVREGGTDLAVLEQVFERLDYSLSDFGTQADRFYAHTAMAAQPLIIDAGANIGASAVWFADRFPTAQVVAIEPEPDNYALLARNAKAFPLVQPVRAALGSRDGTGFCYDPGRGDWGYRVSAKPHEDGAAVPMITVDSITEHYAQCSPLVCKIDIEGGEAELFSYRTRWVTDFPLIVIELHDWMLPGQGTSHNFICTLAQHNFDVLLRGENLFCFNNELLRDK